MHIRLWDDGSTWCMAPVLRLISSVWDYGGSVYSLHTPKAVTGATWMGATPCQGLRGSSALNQVWRLWEQVPQHGALI